MNFKKIEFLSAVLLISKDASSLAKFYRDIVGLPLVEEKHGDTKAHYGCELGDVHFAIHPLENFNVASAATGSVRLAFNVFNMEAFAIRVRDLGTQLLYEPKDVGFCVMTALHDPDGNYIEFTELKDSWFKHLEKRKNEGHDVVHQWKQKLNKQ